MILVPVIEYLNLSEGYQDGAVQKQRQILSAVPVHLVSCQSLPVETEVWLLDLLLGRRS